MKMKTCLEAWCDDKCTSCASAERALEMREKGLLSAPAGRLYEFWAGTHEEAAVTHHVRIGWEPYKCSERRLRHHEPDRAVSGITGWRARFPLSGLLLWAP